MPLLKYVCKTCQDFENYDESKVIEHEEILVTDMGIDGLILRDNKGEYHVFRKTDFMDESHKVFYGKKVVCAPKESVLSVGQEAMAMNMTQRMIMPMCQIEKITEEDVIRKRKESGWVIPERIEGSIGYDKDSLRRIIIKDNLTAIVDHKEFVDVVRNIREANPGKYVGFHFSKNIPESLK